MISIYKTATLNYQIIVILGLFLFPICVFPFAPFVAFISSMLALLITSSYNNKIIRVFFSVLAYTSLAIIYASRAYKEELEMDLSIYYDVFTSISQGYFAQALLIFGKGVEGGLVILYKIYYELLGEITPYHLAFFNMMLCGLGCIYWLEKYGLKNIPYKYKGYCAFFFILFFTIQMAGFLQRQALATTILLFALSQEKRKNFFFLLALGTFFHLTTLPLGLFFRYLLRNDLTKQKIIKITIFILLFRLSFSAFAIIGSGLSILGAEKLLHFTEAEFSIASGRFVILIVLLLAFLFRSNSKENEYRDFLIVSCIFYLLFLGVPLFSERVFFIILYMYGFYLFITTYRKYLKWIMPFGMLYFVLFSLEKMNVLRALNDEFWQRYPMFSFEPFYYFYNW